MCIRAVMAGLKRREPSDALLRGEDMTGNYLLLKPHIIEAMKRDGWVVRGNTFTKAGEDYAVRFKPEVYAGEEGC